MAVISILWTCPCGLGRCQLFDGEASGIQPQGESQQRVLLPCLSFCAVFFMSEMTENISYLAIFMLLRFSMKFQLKLKLFLFCVYSESVSAADPSVLRPWKSKWVLKEAACYLENQFTFPKWFDRCLNSAKQWRQKTQRSQCEVCNWTFVVDGVFPSWCVASYNRMKRVGK